VYIWPYMVHECPSSDVMCSMDITDWITEWITEWMTEWIMEWITEWISEWIPF
jgi:hypothetical protein